MNSIEPPISASEQPPPRHVFLVDGSGFIFRAFHKLPPMTRPDGTPVNAVFGFTTMLLKLLGETDADHLAIIFDASKRTFRNDLFAGYKAQRPDPPDELLPQFALIRDAVRAFNVACVEFGRLGGRRPDRDLHARRLRAGRRGYHRLLRQGPDAADPAGRHHARPGQQPDDRPGAGEGEVLRRPRAGHRRPGAGRRQHRQRSGRARHRRQDRRPADHRVRRSGDPAGPRPRDQAAEASPGADRPRRRGANLARPGAAARRRAVAGAAGRPGQAPARPGPADGLPAGAGVPLADRPPAGPGPDRTGASAGGGAVRRQWRDRGRPTSWCATMPPWCAGSPRRRPPASSPCRSRPTPPTRCAPTWSVCRWRWKRGAPATCRWRMAAATCSIRRRRSCRGTGPSPCSSRCSKTPRCSRSATTSSSPCRCWPASTSTLRRSTTP